MLIRFKEEQKVFSIAQMYWQTTHMLAPVRWKKKTAVVLGPISSNDPTIVANNILVLQKRARELSRSGLNVLDITSYHETLTRLIVEGDVPKCPFGIREEFTIPLIREGWFNIIHFRQPLLHDVETWREYEMTTEIKRLHKVDVVGF